MVKWFAESYETRILENHGSVGKATILVHTFILLSPQLFLLREQLLLRPPVA